LDLLNVDQVVSWLLLVGFCTWMRRW